MLNHIGPWIHNTYVYKGREPDNNDCTCKSTCIGIDSGSWMEGVGKLRHRGGGPPGDGLRRNINPG